MKALFGILLLCSFLEAHAEDLPSCLAACWNVAVCEVGDCECLQEFYNCVENAICNADSKYFYSLVCSYNNYKLGCDMVCPTRNVSDCVLSTDPCEFQRKDCYDETENLCQCNDEYFSCVRSYDCYAEDVGFENETENWCVDLNEYYSCSIDCPRECEIKATRCFDEMAKDCVEDTCTCMQNAYNCIFEGCYEEYYDQCLAEEECELDCTNSLNTFTTEQDTTGQTVVDLTSTTEKAENTQSTNGAESTESIENTGSATNNGNTYTSSAESAENTGSATNNGNTYTSSAESVGNTGSATNTGKTGNAITEITESVESSNTESATNTGNTGTSNTESAGNTGSATNTGNTGTGNTESTGNTGTTTITGKTGTVNTESTESNESTGNTESATITVITGPANTESAESTGTATNTRNTGTADTESTSEASKTGITEDTAETAKQTQTSDQQEVDDACKLYALYSSPAIAVIWTSVF